MKKPVLLIIPIISEFGEKILWIGTLLSLLFISPIVAKNLSRPHTNTRQIDHEAITTRYIRMKQVYEEKIKALERRIAELEDELRRLREGRRPSEPQTIIKEVEEVTETPERETVTEGTILITEEDRIRELKQRILAAEELLQRASELYKKGALSEEIFLRIKNQCEDRIREYRRKLSELEGRR